MLQSYIASVLLLASIGGRGTNALNLPYVPPTAEVLAAEGIEPRPQPFRPAALLAASSGSAISPAGWTVTADSFQAGNPPSNVIDGNTTTLWHSQFSPVLAKLPHTITIDMKAVFNVDGLTYLPRQDVGLNGNIGMHQIFVSTDGTNFGNPVAFGTWFDDKTEKVAAFETVPARYIKIVALSEAGGRGPWSTAAEIKVYNAGSFTPPPTGLGKWGPTIDFPTVPVAAAVEPNSGKIVVWSAYYYNNFRGGSGKTSTAVYDPASLTVSQRILVNTGHDMFCPGISYDANGRLVVTGGEGNNRTSIYDTAVDTWKAAAEMNIARGYQSTATCSDGRIFVIGGSWSGAKGGKNGEIYDPKVDSWTLLPGCPVAPMLTADHRGVYRSDNHGWLFGWKNGFIFQAGPSRSMNWYNTAGSGGQIGAGLRATDAHSMCGDAVMYDAVNGKILTVGGSVNYEGSQASSAAHIITLGTPGSIPAVTTITSMAFPRIFANAVVLPDGQVFITGGQTWGEPFTDANATLTPEMWNPTTMKFTSLVPNSIPRTYHSVALLLPDATVFTGGGGLCGTCSTNHFDAQIYTPQYLLNADGSAATRPVINSISSVTVLPGATITVTTDSVVTSMSLLRYGSSTHTVNTDQRRIPLQPLSVGTNKYTIAVPNDYGIALPGYWMLFAINAAGRPSVAKTVLIKGP